MLGWPGDVTQLIRSTLASPTNGDPRWYAHVSGENFGPYGRSDIERLIRNRQLQAQDYLCPEGGAEWVQARNDPTFGPLLSERVDVAAIRPNTAPAPAIGDTPSVRKELQSKETPVGPAKFRVPWLTFSILVVLIVIFMLENTPGNGGATPSIATLVAFGALSRKLVVSDGQWFRLFTAPLLHGNFPHILGNGLALALGGWILENLVGRLWFFTIFTIAALGGSLVSIALNPVDLVSVGASGALMGMFAALFVAGFHFPFGTAGRMSLQFNSLRILVPSLLPFLQPPAAGRIDYAAHVGGMLSGAVVMLLLLRCWPKGARIPQLWQVAVCVLAICALLFVTSVGLSISNHRKFVQSLQPKDVLEDHGPKRAACDFQWNTLQSHDAAAYRPFLQKCMYGNSTSR